MGRKESGFKEDKELYPEWINHALKLNNFILEQEDGMCLEPIVFLIKFEQFMNRHNEIC